MRKPEELRDVYADVARTIKEYQEVLEIHLAEKKPKPGDIYTEYLNNKISELKSNQILLQWILKEDMDKEKTNLAEVFCEKVDGREKKQTEMNVKEFTEAIDNLIKQHQDGAIPLEVFNIKKNEIYSHYLNM